MHVQVGQTFIIACAVLLHNLMQLAGWAGQDAVGRDAHLFSAYLMLPLATTSLALLHFNWWVQRAFQLSRTPKIDQGTRNAHLLSANLSCLHSHHHMACAAALQLMGSENMPNP